ncbi:Conserved hypothetical protein (glycosyl transferase?) [Mycobacteroides abscessus]|nr:Conserved hypothetical protein (glycosyl transferase?) [Mycobacteroides abscessus]
MTSTVGIDSSWMSSAPQPPGWLETHSWNRPEWTVEQLIAAKKGRTVSVVLPALNEQETVAAVIDTISPLLGGLVDELIVLDSGSTDDTAIRAVAAGARVVSREQALPEVPPNPGKGEVLWRSVAATTGDLIAFVDSDLIDPDPMFVPHLLGPLLLGQGIHLVKGFYRRPLKVSGAEDANGGGRGPNWWPGPCSRHFGPNSVASSSRWAASMPGPGSYCPPCPSHRGMAWRSVC